MRLFALTLAACLTTGAAYAQAPAAAPAAPAATRAIFERADTEPNQEVVFGSARFPEKGVAATHTHPGVEMGFLLEGEVEIRVQGQPPRTLRQGQSFLIPRDTPHSAHNVGSGPALMSNVWMVDKGKPMATPVAAPAP